MAYLFDTNVFLRAHSQHYGMSFCPAFWEWLVLANAAGHVYSIEKVGDELLAQDDDLAGWARKLGDTFFLKPDDAMASSLQTVATWVNGHVKYTQAAKSIFFNAADYYLVAHALAHNHVVVTQELPGDKPNQVKIPNACIGVKVKVMNPFEILRLAKVRFTLQM